MAWSFSSGSPVYLQIAQRLMLSVLSGEYPPEAQIPTVRQLALEAAVNPNTIQHAFAELESNGIIVPKGTIGRFVTDDTQVIETCRRQMAEEAVRQFVKNLEQLSVSPQQAIAMIEEVIQ